MADQRGPAVRRRRLAAELRRLRTVAELTLEQAAAKLGDGWSCSKISRVETARLGISQPVPEGLAVRDVAPVQG